MIGESREKGSVFDTENLDDYWKEVETEEEFRNSVGGFRATDYRTASKIVKAITGKSENILIEYKKIVEMAKEQERQRSVKNLAEYPDFKPCAGDPNILTFDHGDRQFSLAIALPRKKGSVDDTFVFQKKLETEQ